MVSLSVCVLSLVHLGHTLTVDLKDDSDIYRCSHDFVKNIIMLMDCFVLTKLLNTFYMYLFGCALCMVNSFPCD